VADTVDVDGLTTHLYSSPPEDFVKVRGDGARELKAAGQSEAAADFAKLAKPSLSAWAVNVLAGQRADIIDEVVERGDELRAAHTGGADGKQIRAAHQARQEAIRRATVAAVELTGRQLSDAHREEVTATLEAASFDESAAAEVRGGRLVRPLDAPTGFGMFGGLTVITGGRSGGRRSRADERAAAATTDDDSEDDARRARAEMLLAEAEAARGDAESAGEEAAALRDQLTEREAERERLEGELQRLDKDLATMRRQLRDADRAAAEATRKAVRAATRAERAGT
jgi:hypothetical protein